MATTESLLRFPVTLAIILINGAVFAFQSRQHTPLAAVARQNGLIEERKQFWRVLTGALSHGNLIHLAMNMLSLTALRRLESAIGPLQYFKLNWLLILISEVLLIAVGKACSHLTLLWPQLQVVATQLREEMAVGYSGVVFGLFAVSAQLSATGISLGPVKVPISATPFIQLVITQLLVPNASFGGHLAGLISGLLIGAGCFRWLFSDYLFCCLFLWSCIVGLGSALATGAIDRFPGIKLLPNERAHAILVDGRIEYAQATEV